MRAAPPIAASEAALRQDLAATFRLRRFFGWSETVGDPFSAAVSSDGRSFLLNTREIHFDAIQTCDLLLNADENPMAGLDPPDASAWTIDGTPHREVPEARGVLHRRSPYATSLACSRTRRTLRSKSTPPGFSAASLTTM